MKLNTRNIRGLGRIVGMTCILQDHKNTLDF